MNAVDLQMNAQWALAATASFLVWCATERRVKGWTPSPATKESWCRRFLVRDFSVPVGRDMSAKVLAAFGDDMPREWRWRTILFCSWWAMECRGEVSVFLDDKITSLAESFERLKLPASITESWHDLATALHAIQEAAHREQTTVLEAVQ